MVRLILEFNKKEKEALGKSKGDFNKFLKKTKEGASKVAKKVGSSFQIRVVEKHSKSKKKTPTAKKTKPKTKTSKEKK